MFLDPRNGPAWDLAGSPHTHTYVVLATPRTASTLLCRTLWDTGRAAAPKEYCNPMQAHDWAVRRGERVPPAILRVLWERTRSARAQRRHLDHVLARRTDHTGLFGLKLQPDQLLRWFGSPDALEKRLGPVSWVVLHRHDTTAQIDSWHRAATTGQWRAGAPASPRTPVPRTWLTHQLNQQTTAINTWMAPRPHLRLTTESVTTDLSAALRTVLAFIGRDASGAMPRPALQRQF